MGIFLCSLNYSAFVLPTTCSFSKWSPLFPRPSHLQAQFIPLLEAVLTEAESVRTVSVLLYKLDFQLSSQLRVGGLPRIAYFYILAIS